MRSVTKRYFRMNKVIPITPVFKKGSKSKPSNYRLISLKSQVAKILESFVCDRVSGRLSERINYREACVM